MLQERVTSLDDPRLAIYRNLRTTNGLRDASLFVAEGPTVVDRVLRSGFQVHSVVISDRKFGSFESRLPDDVPILRLSQELAEELVGFPFHCGVMASVQRRPTPELTHCIPTDGPALLVAADRVTDPENVGALIRIASAFGADAVILGPGSADPFSRRVLRVSMANGLFLPIVESASLTVSLQTARQRGLTVCGTQLNPSAASLTTYRFHPRTVLVFGNEYDGLSTDVSNVLDQAITIPMLNGTDSLNVAVSSGICLFSYRSQIPG